MLRFSAKAQIVETDDFVAAVLDISREEKAVKVGLIVDPRLIEHSEIRRLEATLVAAGLTLNRQAGPNAEPTTDMVDAAAALFRAAPPDLLVGIGGGSTLDLAKAVSVMALVDASVTDYHGTGKPLVKGIR